MQAGTKVAFNTFVMYAKVVLTVGITLYSTRLILSELGENDFGAFSLVAGMVGMMMFLTASASVATQRYMSYALGMNDRERFFEVYKIAEKLSLLLGVVIVVTVEVLGFFFLDKLDIAPERVFAVQIVFHCTVAITFFSIMILPYEAAIVAHEDIFVISLIYIAESFLKLGVAVYLIYSPFDKLIVYAVLLFLIYLNSSFCKKIYCRKYGKSQIWKKTDRKLFSEIAKFSVWSSFEPFSGIFSVQGIAIILNIFGGMAVNTAYGIANQVNGQMNYFSASLLTAINPQITKSESGGDRKRTVRLSLLACKVSFFLLAFFSIPLLVEMPYVLKLWLKNVPEYTVLFCRLILASTLIMQLTYGFQGGIQAIGRIRNYQTMLGAVRLLSLPAVYVLLKMGMPIYVAVLSFVFVETVNLMLRLHFAGKTLKIRKTDFLIKVFSKLVVSFLSVYLLLQGMLYFWREESFVRLLITVALGGLALTIMLRRVILNKEEYEQIKNILTNFLKKKGNEK
jgi:O-antigen/teichoic acid export membrane protein